MNILDLNELIREIVVLVHNEVSRAAITVHTELAAGVPRIPGDRVQLQQVMMNLILNGIPFYQQPGEVLMELKTGRVSGSACC